MDTDTDTDTDTTEHLHWVSQDRQSEICGGQFPVGVDRDAAEEEFLAELIEQAGTDAALVAIRAGVFRWLAHK